MSEWDVTIRFGNGRVERVESARVEAPDAGSAVEIAALRGGRAHGRMMALETIAVVPVPGTPEGTPASTDEPEPRR